MNYFRFKQKKKKKNLEYSLLFINSILNLGNSTTYVNKNKIDTYQCYKNDFFELEIYNNPYIYQVSELYFTEKGHLYHFYFIYLNNNYSNLINQRKPKSLFYKEIHDILLNNLMRKFIIYNWKWDFKNYSIVHYSMKIIKIHI